MAGGQGHLGGAPVPHHAAYAGWRLAECLLDAGQRKAAEDGLAAAYRPPRATSRFGAPSRASRAVRGWLYPQTRTSTRIPPRVGDLAPHGLTSRELDVLRLLGTGATNAEIGRRLYMSPKTASVHVSAIIRKLGVTGRVQAATVAERMGLLVDKTGPAGDA